MSNVLAKAMTGEIDKAVGELEAMCDAVPVPVEDAPTARVLPFANRFAAGRLLGQALAHFARTDAIVLGIAPGGLAVAHGLAAELELRLDVWLVRRLVPDTAPGLVLGVISEGASLVLDRIVLARSGLTETQVKALVKENADQMVHDARRYRRGLPMPSVKGKTVILVDDGISTGGTLSAAISGVRRSGATRVVVASPVGAQSAIESLSSDANQVVCLTVPQRLRRIGAWYQDYRPVTESSVMKILAGPDA
jgi:putative phosphoribosyl transferase